MTKYTTERPRSWYYWECDLDLQRSPVTNSTVSETVPFDTGLYDANGNKLWRMPNKIGF